ncbi:MAG: ATP-binding protein [Tenuifilaceae bacterium]|jgi:signal transduction histidine kinase|nr:ATP-binding protein [Tenuifilaceae bacterium]
MDKRFSPILIIILISVTAGWIFHILTVRSFNIQLSQYLSEQNKHAQVKVNSAINTYNLVSDILFNQVVNQPKILAQFAKACSSDSCGKKAVRDSLYAMLQPTYEQIKQINIKQLHFHLPNNHSFLRFHRPERFGDDLTNYRYSVKYSNQTKQIAKGFEEGKIYNGFRYVYPLSFNGQHIGTVETSFSYEAISYQLGQLGTKKSTLAIKKEMVLTTVFKDEQDNYEISLLSDNYYIEKQFSHYQTDSSGLFKTIDSRLKVKIQDDLAQNKRFTTYYNVKGQYYTVNFIPINNMQNIPAAYIITYDTDSNIRYFFRNFRFRQILGLIFIPIASTILFFFIRFNRRIKEQNRELTKLNADKDQFFQIIAHDLRTPFSSLMGFSELLYKEIDNFGLSKTKEYLFIIWSTSRKTYTLLEDLLLWGKSQAGKLPYSPETISLKNICEDSISVFIDTPKNIQFSCIVDIDLKVKADVNMLKTILRNLISNAIKFTSQNGKVTIDAKKDNDSAIITITDTGVGIDKDMIIKIWGTNSNYTTRGTDGERGSGLGLPLCKMLIEKQSGRIWVKSQVGKGSQFIFTLPLST